MRRPKSALCNLVYTKPMVSAVVLAAGASTRMGQQKLLLPLEGDTLVRRVVNQVAGAGFDDVLVVVGSEFEQVLLALKGLPVRHAVNADFARVWEVRFERP